LSTHYSPVGTVSPFLFCSALLPPFSQHPVPLRRPTFFGLREIIFHVLIRSRPRPRALAHTHTMSHNAQVTTPS
jgi:hypothetical protein